MDLVSETDAYLVEDIDDRVPAVGEICVPLLDDLVINRREHRHVVPDRRSSESDNGVHTESGGRTCGDLHLFGGSPAYALWIAVAPDARVDHVLVAIVDDRLAHRLAIDVIRYCPTPKPVLFEEILPALNVAVVLGRFGNIEMITPAGDLQSVIAPCRGEPGHLLEGEIGPLSGEQGDRSWLGWHGCASSFLQLAGVVSDHRILLVGLHCLASSAPIHGCERRQVSRARRRLFH